MTRMEVEQHRAEKEMPFAMVFSKEELQEQKRKLRKQGLSVRNSLSMEYRTEADEQILNRLLNMRAYQRAELILTYVNYQSEVDTKGLIRHSLAVGKRVAVPKVTDRQGQMEFYEIGGLSDLVKGYQGIEEPAAMDKQPVCLWEEEKRLVEKEKDRNMLMILPGAVFDMHGNRIGYGGGFYDRYLQQNACEKLRTAAVGYDVQIVKEIPAEMHDYQVEQVVTERREMERILKN